MTIIFPKDILVLDFEAAYLPEDKQNPEKSFPTQVGAVLLDKDTLEEKKSFVSYIYQDLSGTALEAKTVSGITQEKLNGAPTLSEVGKKFFETFGTDFLFCSWVSELDRTLFRKMVFAAGMHTRDFDYHVYDLWPIGYTYLLKRGYTGTMRSEPMFQAFGLPPRAAHDALEDSRYAATALRKILAD